MSEPAGYHFRLARKADLPLLLRWRAMPDVVRWWGAWNDGPAEFGSDLVDPNILMWIVEHEGRPFAYAQDHDPHAWDPHHFSYLPPGSRGIDQYIGEPGMLDRGHGSAFLRQYCANCSRPVRPRSAPIPIPTICAPAGLTKKPASPLSAGRWRRAGAAPF